MKLGLIVNCKIKFMPAYSCYNYVDCETILWQIEFYWPAMYRLLAWHQAPLPKSINIIYIYICIYKPVSVWDPGRKAQLAALSRCCPYQRRQQKSFGKNISHKCRDTRRYKSPNVPLFCVFWITFCCRWIMMSFALGPESGKKETQGPKSRTKAELVNTFIIVKSCWVGKMGHEVGAMLEEQESLSSCQALSWPLPFICPLFRFLLYGVALWTGSCGVLNRFKFAFKWNKWATFRRTQLEICTGPKLVKNQLLWNMGVASTVTHWSCDGKYGA